MKLQLLQEVTPKGVLKNEGNKARHLSRLISKGTHVPKTWVIGTDVYSQYSSGLTVKPTLLIEINKILDPNQSYAVRSSSNIEDGLKYSFAGLFKTILNVKGADDILDAVVSIWDSTNSNEIRTYVKRLKIAEENIAMAVIIQEMVQPVYSGVVFSKNPMTGSDEYVIEAVKGQGTALVQDGATPERYIFKAGRWITTNDQGSIPLNVIENVLKNAQRINKKNKQPLDFEWVFDGKDVFWVQMREITAMNQVKVYSNRFSKDMMPGMIHPLIWSINVPMINSMWIGLLEELVGKLGIKADDLARSFYYRSYFDMGTIGKVFNKVGFPSEGLEMMMGMLPKQEGRPVYRPSIKSIYLLPRLVKFVFSKWHFEKQIEKELPIIEKTSNDFRLDTLSSASANDVLQAIEMLYLTVQRSAYINILTPIIASMYTRILEKQLNKLGYQISNIDLTQGISEMAQYNPSISLAELKRELDSLDSDVKDMLETSQLEDLRNNVSFHRFFELYDAFMIRFGHLSDNSNNFTAVSWRDQPNMVIDLIRNFQRSEQKSDTHIVFSEIKLKGPRKLLITNLYNRVRQYILYREKVSRAYTYDYGLFRPHFLRLANLMKEKGWIKEEDQIFFLQYDEIRQAFRSNNGSNLASIAEERCLEMQKVQDIQLPDVIYGDDPPPFFPKVYNRYKGTPTSQGYYSGNVKIIHGIADFSKVKDGDVIVIPYSDIGWMPIFAKAGAVIAESGGMLSHSSIIAREYKIPAVVSVSNALLLKNNQKVSVNGYTGEILVLDDLTEDTKEIS